MPGRGDACGGAHRRCQLAPVLSRAPSGTVGLCCTDFRGMQHSGMVFSQCAGMGACGGSSEISRTGVIHCPSCRLLVKPPVLCGLSMSGSRGGLLGGLGHRVSASPRAWAGAALAQPPLRGADVMEDGLYCCEVVSLHQSLVLQSHSSLRRVGLNSLLNPSSGRLPILPHWGF